MRASFQPQSSDNKNAKVSVGGVMREQRDTQKERKSKIKEDRTGKDFEAEAKQQFDAMPKQAALELSAAVCQTNLEFSARVLVSEFAGTASRRCGRRLRRFGSAC